jgi:hypothetical protein
MRGRLAADVQPGRDLGVAEAEADSRTALAQWTTADGLRFPFTTNLVIAALA